MSQRRKYSNEFRLEVVRMANALGLTLNQIGEEQGVSPHLPGKWRKGLQARGIRMPIPVREEMWCSNERSRESGRKEILREAARFFATGA